MSTPARMMDHADEAARAAGEYILACYGTDRAFSIKGDGSPLTEADQGAHDAIVESLSTTNISIVSEEATNLNVRATRYWLVDPLDGTKDFLAGNDEFTVNIALVEDGCPVLGVLYAPALNETYFGLPGDGAWHRRKNVCAACEMSPKSCRLRMASSRFHDHPDTAIFAKANGVATRVRVGSALKYGRLAMGEVDVYPRLVGTSEWDTAAGQAVLEGAGGSILDWKTGEPLRYGKPRRRNGPFLAFRKPYQANDFRLMAYDANWS